MIFNLGRLPNKYAGNRYEANSDFVWRGGILIISRLDSPAAILSNASAIFLW